MMNLNRRSFLRGASLSIATFVVGTVVNPLATASGILSQKKILDGISIESGNIPKGIKLVETMKAEKAFLIGFKRIGHNYAKLLQYVDVEPIGPGFGFTGKVGQGIDTCSFNFQCNNLMTVDFDYMKDITDRVYKGVEFYFNMPKEGRLMCRMP